MGCLQEWRDVADDGPLLSGVPRGGRRKLIKCNDLDAPGDMMESDSPSSHDGIVHILTCSYTTLCSSFHSSGTGSCCIWVIPYEIFPL
ncbi:hypothetical protein EMCRGX_G014235 [Ephydatia muelleri]